ncbi:MAG: hypothetical protein QHH12_08160 [Candidatus Bathyarchaeota archaeon]|nr:hypothetical protein [Candidatus Bathyarchaeota archaeon]
MKKHFFSLMLILLMFISPVFGVAEGEEVNFGDLPKMLASALNIDLFSAKILASAILLCLFLFPALFFSSRFDFSAMLTVVIVGLPVSGLCVALGWLPVWLCLMVCFIVALMFSGQMRDWITGKGRG